MKELGFSSQKDFAAALNIEPGSLSDIIRGKVGVSKAIKHKLEILFSVSREWIESGNGPTFKGVKKDSTSNSDTIPLIPVEAMAGNGGGEVSITEHDIQARYIVPEFTGADFMIPVKGSSMYPKYNSGDIIACRIIKERTFFQWGRVYVIHDREQGTMVKRLFKGSKDGWLECKSDNPSYPAFEVPLDNITNVALVIGVIRLE